VELDVDPKELWIWQISTKNVFFYFEIQFFQVNNKGKDFPFFVLLKN
jgi:hypothetical protein